MICVIALIVFGVLGIFSVRYRRLAKEALDCVFRRITFRKCTSRLDERLKSKITGKLMTKSPRLAISFYKNFEIFSWIFTILLILSLFYSAKGIYNYAVYGNCNGPNSDQFCIFTPFSEQCVQGCEGCTNESIGCGDNCTCEEGKCPEKDKS